jgi:hypothetical protein
MNVCDRHFRAAIVQPAIALKHRPSNLATITGRLPSFASRQT